MKHAWKLKIIYNNYKMEKHIFLGCLISNVTIKMMKKWLNKIIEYLMHNVKEQHATHYVNHSTLHLLHVLQQIK
jgi:hypothetical protein